MAEWKRMGNHAPWYSLIRTKGYGMMEDIIPAWRCKRYMKLIRKELKWVQIRPREKLSFLHGEFARMLHKAVDLMMEGNIVILPCRYGKMSMFLEKARKPYTLNGIDMDHSQVFHYWKPILKVEGYRTKAKGFHPFTGKKLFAKYPRTLKYYIQGNDSLKVRLYEQMCTQRFDEPKILKFADWKDSIYEDGERIPYILNPMGRYDLYTLGTKAMVKFLERDGCLRLRSQRERFNMVLETYAQREETDTWKGQLRRMLVAMHTAEDDVTPEAYFPLTTSQRLFIENGGKLTAFFAYKSVRAGTVVGDFCIIKDEVLVPTYDKYTFRIAKGFLVKEDLVTFNREKFKFRWLKEHRKMTSVRGYCKIMGLSVPPIQYT